MNGISMVGVTYRGAPMPLLEQVAVCRAERTSFLLALSDAGYPEAVVLSTCSRTEIYLGAAGGGAEGLLPLLARHAGRSRADVQEVAEIRAGPAVVDHLFQVVAGLDSRVIGEVEIHGQVRQAFRVAQAAGMTGPALGQLFPAALRCGVRVRSQTALGAQARSLGHRAVDVGLAALPQVADPVIIVVGSGRMASAAVEHLRRLGRQPHVTARNQAHAARLVGPAMVCPLPALDSGLVGADLLICATSAAHHVVTLDHVRHAMTARTRGLVLVDLSVPRNVDAAVATIPGVRLIDLEGMNDDTSSDPALAAALEQASQLVTAGARRYADAVAARAAGPVIAALRQRVEETCLRELTSVVPARTVGSAELARAAHAIAGKLMHRPTINARAAAANGDADSLRTLCDLFGLQLSELRR
ncbi:glutamyl-tRNA reductase [soil metagenome]